MLNDGCITLVRRAHRATPWFVLLVVVGAPARLELVDVPHGATLATLPVLYAILSAVLFGVQMLKTCRHDMSCWGHTPRSVRKERQFIPWETMRKVDPWAVEFSDLKTEK